MPGRTPAEAVKAYRLPLQEAICCIDLHAVISASGRIVGLEQVLVLAQPPAKLNGTGGLTLDISQRYEIIPYKTGREKWRVTTRGYSYIVRDGTNRDLFIYQWHPAGLSHVTSPHLHIGAGASVDTVKAANGGHLKTGQRK